MRNRWDQFLQLLTLFVVLMVLVRTVIKAQEGGPIILIPGEAIEIVCQQIVSTPTETAVVTMTNTPTVIPTETSTDVPTSTPVPTIISTSTPTPTDVPTSTPTPGATEEPTLISQDNWLLIYADSEETVGEDGRATNAFDGSSTTFWHTEWRLADPPHPHEIQIDIGDVYNIAGFRYMPRQDLWAENGRVADYEFYVSESLSEWTFVAAGTWVNSATEKEVLFSAVPGRYVRLVALSEVNDNPWTTAAELNILVVSETGPTPTPGPTETPTPTLEPGAAKRVLFLHHSVGRITYAWNVANPYDGYVDSDCSDGCDGLADWFYQNTLHEIKEVEWPWGHGQNDPEIFVDIWIGSDCSEAAPKLGSEETRAEIGNVCSIADLNGFDVIIFKSCYTESGIDHTTMQRYMENFDDLGLEFGQYPDTIFVTWNLFPNVSGTVYDRQFSEWLRDVWAPQHPNAYVFDVFEYMTYGDENSFYSGYWWGGNHPTPAAGELLALGGVNAAGEPVIGLGEFIVSIIESGQSSTKNTQRAY